jgi:hypothetical protein
VLTMPPRKEYSPPSSSTMHQLHKNVKLAATLLDTTETLTLLRIPEEQAWDRREGADLVAHGFAVCDIPVHKYWGRPASTRAARSLYRHGELGHPPP